MITAFTDCDSESIVLRVPYKLAVDMAQYLPSSEDKEELLEKMRRASLRSNKLSNLLKDLNKP